MPTFSPRADHEHLVAELQKDATPARLTLFARSLGVASEALMALRAGYDRRGTWAFPMVDATNRVVGIRYRCPRTARKWSQRGGHEGVFLAHDCVLGEPLLFPEGPTDTAAALSMGFSACGRPSCSGGIRYCTPIARKLDCIVVADRDEPGQRGARQLANALLLVAKSVRVVTPPAKDLREWLNSGARREDVQSLIDAAPVQRLRVRYRQ